MRMIEKFKQTGHADHLFHHFNNSVFQMTPQPTAKINLFHATHLKNVTKEEGMS